MWEAVKEEIKKQNIEDKLDELYKGYALGCAILVLNKKYNFDKNLLRDFLINVIKTSENMSQIKGGLSDALLYMSNQVEMELSEILLFSRNLNVDEESASEAIL